MSVLALLQETAIVLREVSAYDLDLAQVFTLLFVVMGPPLKTPAIYYARMQAFDSATRRAMAWKTFILATVAVLIGGFVGFFLQKNWNISPAAMLFAGGIIFLLISLRTVLEQYEPHVEPYAVAENAASPKPPVPSAFDLAVPMIVTPYGLAGLIIILTFSQDVVRTFGIVTMLLIVMILHLLAMLFAGPIMRSIGPMPFKLFGTIIGSLTVGLSIQMMIEGFRHLDAGIF